MSISKNQIVQCPKDSSLQAQGTTYMVYGSENERAPRFISRSVWWKCGWRSLENKGKILRKSLVAKKESISNIMD